MKATPLLKEDRLEYILESLQCFQTSPLDRDRQKQCVLNVYVTKSERSQKDLREQEWAHMDKSIFRGMVIPSLRYLGLIIGDGEFLRLSSNGALAVAADSCSPDLKSRVLASLVYEIDQSQFKYLSVISSQPSPRQVLESCLSNALLTSGPSERQRRERTRHWLHLLADTGLVENKNGVLRISELYSVMPQLLEVRDEDIDWFLPALFSSHKQLVQSFGSECCSIVDLRRQVSLDELKKSSRIVTRQRFDQLMQLVPFEGKDYMLSFGVPIGWGEDLIRYHDKQYSTLIITARR